MNKIQLDSSDPRVAPICLGAIDAIRQEARDPAQ